MCYTSAKSDTVGVRELRRNLSEYLRRVKKGERLPVTGRGQLVAVLTPPEGKLSGRERWIAEGLLQPATRSLRDLGPPIQLSPEQTAAFHRALEEEREERLP